MAESMVPNIKVGDVMTKDVLAIDVDDTLDVIAGLFDKYDYDGLPVIDKEHKLRGVITAYDMVLQSSDVHIPTLIKLMEQIAREKGDRRVIDAYFAKLKDIKATSIMNTKVISIAPEATLEDAAKLFADHHRVNPLCVVDAAGVLVGVISRYDVIKFFNEAYLQQVVSTASPGADPFKEFPTRSDKEVETAIQQMENEFLLVQKRRPLVWKYIAIAAFAAGLVAATALIIRIVQNQG
ncbi:MAG TPA: CBS domain-containing protein [Candidatus Paceibacterota bacterium]|nr:CBS domain-containing protein [Candidatus Paceibacterota bacterium]